MIRLMVLLTLLLLTGCVTEREWLAANETAVLDRRCIASGVWLAELNDTPPLRTVAAEQERLRDLRFYRRVMMARCLLPR